MDPEVKKYFKKILSSFTYGLLWLQLIVTTGIYFKLAFVDHGLRWYNLAFYLGFLLSLLLLVRYYYRLWKPTA